ncbi:hypothetical protein SCOCK_110132 [Actinacidiphila cocklensis]|uniref:Uncharacterized protein n=1 Tax=Actinacidiphila cocklensis TaxID=887465 RepID=A0A9W4GP73_9ACTN|nr:hypothetical protein SCOCK_110132 [Actinacidiphila cocklensis]
MGRCERPGAVDRAGPAGRGRLDQGGDRAGRHRLLPAVRRGRRQGVLPGALLPRCGQQPGGEGDAGRHRQGRRYSRPVQPGRIHRGPDDRARGGVRQRHRPDGDGEGPGGLVVPGSQGRRADPRGGPRAAAADVHGEADRDRRGPEARADQPAAEGRGHPAVEADGRLIRGTRTPTARPGLVGGRRDHRGRGVLRRAPGRVPGLHRSQRGR